MAAYERLLVAWDFLDGAMRVQTRRSDARFSPLWSDGFTEGVDLFFGAKPGEESEASLDIKDNALTVGRSTLEVPDKGGKLTAWLAANEGSLANSKVIRRLGAMDEDEIKAVQSFWIFRNYGMTDDGAGYRFEFEPVISQMQAPIFDELSSESRRLDGATHSGGLATGATSITLDSSPADWPAAGTVLLYDAAADVHELIDYAGLAGSVLSALTRRKYGVGDMNHDGTPDHVFDATETTVTLVWSMRGHPLDLALRVATTTDAAGDSVPAELLSDVEISSWSDPFTMVDWNVNTGASALVSQSTDNSGPGVNSAKFEGTGAGGGLPNVSQSFTGVEPDKWYKLRVLAWFNQVAEGGNGGLRIVFANVTRSRSVNGQPAWDSEGRPIGGVAVATGWFSGVSTAAIEDTFAMPARNKLVEISLMFQTESTFQTSDTCRVQAVYRDSVNVGGDYQQSVSHLAFASLEGPFDEQPNGAYDVGDGNGLGLPAGAFDLDTLEDLREQALPYPAFGANDQLATGTAMIFADGSGIEDVKDFIEQELLGAVGLYPSIDECERFSAQQIYSVPPSNTVVIDDEWDKPAFRPSTWERNWKNRINKVRLRTDYSPSSQREYGSERVKAQRTSIKRYGATKSRDIQSRGLRSGLRGFPDLGGAALIDAAGSRVLLEQANPWSPIEIDAFFAHRLLKMSNTVRLNVPAIPDELGGRGLVGYVLFITARRIDIEEGKLTLTLRRRRAVARPAFVGPSTRSADYSAGTSDDREYCYVAPSSGEFPDGSEAYTVVP